MLSFESLKPEDKANFARMNPEIAKWLEEEEAERQEAFSHIWSLDRWYEERDKLRTEMHTRFETYLRTEEGN